MADVSRGNWYDCSMSSVTTPWNVLPSSPMCVTRPTVTPALRTGARTFSPPMLSKRACTV